LELVNNINRSVIGGLRWVTVSRSLAQALTWVNTFFVIRLISPTDFGLAALAGIFANFLSLLNELGFSVTLVRWQTRDEETLRHVFGALLVVGIIFTLGLVLAAPIFGILTKEPRVVPLIRFISIQFLTMSFAVIPQARLSMDMRFKELGIADVIASVIGAAGTLLVALSGGGAWSLIVGTVVLTVSRTVLLNIFSSSIRSPRLNFAKLRHFAGFSGLVLLEKTLWYWYMQIDSFVVGRFLGAAELGIYAVGRQVTNIPLERAMGIINSVALPAFSLVQADRDRVRAGYLKVLRLGAAYAFPVFWGLAVVSEPLVRLVIGVKWIASVIVIQLLCISMPLRMLNSFTAAAVTAIGRQDVNIKSLLLAIVVVPSGVLIGCRWGVTGVAAAWALAFPLVYLFNASLIRRVLHITLREMFVAVSPPAAAAATMGIATFALSRMWLDSLSPWLHAAIAVPFGALVFIGTLWVLSREAALEMLSLARNFASRGR
jgi:O-antigen/teichoic acid export membrane protein